MRKYKKIGCGDTVTDSETSSPVTDPEKSSTGTDPEMSSTGTDCEKSSTVYDHETSSPAKKVHVTSCTPTTCEFSVEELLQKQT